MLEDDTVTSMAAKQMKGIDTQTVHAKLFVFDAGHGLAILEAQQACQHPDVMMRVKGHQVFYHPPSYKGKGRPPKYGERFKLAKTDKEADCQHLISFKNKGLRISTWSGLHAAKSMDQKLTLLKLEFLDDKNQPVFEKPIWLVTTALALDAETIARAYLWRASHELTFRFMKQHLGLTKNQSPDITSCDDWYQLVALAMNILLALRDELTLKPKPWYPQSPEKTVSQRQAQKQALGFFLKLDDITKPTQPAGKACGRPLGHPPPPRTRYPVKRKTPHRPKPCPTCPFKLAA